jgi:mannose-6-phosphate isomerase-like protein (cupin superfamily)/DNA-binding XRE family transcriptional regulator
MDPELRAIGVRLRELRRDRKLTTRELASQANVSGSLISQIENAKVQPSVISLQRIAIGLGVPLAEFFRDPAMAPAGAAPHVPISPPPPPSGNGSNGSPADPHSVSPEPGAVVVVRRDQRRRLQFPNSHVYELLSPNLAWTVEFLMVEIKPGHPPVESRAHAGQEHALVVTGTMHVVAGDDEYVLEPGDCISLDSTVPHRAENRGTETVVQICAITPPRF